MAKGKRLSGDGHKAETTLKQRDMVNRSMKVPDASMGCKGASVNAAPTRSETARSPKTLGPRTA